MTVAVNGEKIFLGTNGYPLQSAAVYGPIHSRRYGYSLGINPLPISYKFCDFDCVYCQYGWTPRPGSEVQRTEERLKSANELLSEVERIFQELTAAQTPVDMITIAGNGEPTLHPDFLKFVKGLVRLRGEYFPGKRIGILSDASQCHRPQIREALQGLEERCMKLDAGDPKTIEQINRPAGGFNLKRTIEALKSLDNVTIQSMFVQGTCDNTQAEQVDRWVNAVGEIQPISVQIYTIDRPPADSRIRPVPMARLHEVAEICERVAGVPTEVFE
ncbi:MAG: hypothetical protein A3G87_09435 [Omnitrophica bacterium RIFCSPLOWO2_12_FULL_50_11]|nr:MAG: hypothetical protein A3G87_09435 [Omnitrophica bacterium RIFCSPLOWO2_12_FULL_50_11]